MPIERGAVPSTNEKRNGAVHGFDLRGLGCPWLAAGDEGIVRLTAVALTDGREVLLGSAIRENFLDKRLPKRVQGVTRAENPVSKKADTLFYAAIAGERDSRQIESYDEFEVRRVGNHGMGVEVWYLSTQVNGVSTYVRLAIGNPHENGVVARFDECFSLKKGPYGKRRRVPVF